MNQTNPTNVTTGDVRLSYAHVFKPFANQPGQEPKYSVTMLIPKSDIATKQRIDMAINAAIQLGVANKWNGVRPPQVKQPVWDGDGVRQSGEPFPIECKGHWVLTASSTQQPGAFDLALNPIINQSDVYSGMYARVNINFFPYFNSGNKGVGCGLNMIQKRADGEPLAGNRVSPEEAFGGGAAAGGYAPPQQPNYMPPQQQNYQQPQQPAYPSNVVPYPGQYQQAPPQPGYAQQPPQMQPNMQYAPQQPVQIDPITGKPIVGGVMGL